MHLEKIQVDKIQNGRLSAIIHLDRPDIVEYHENRFQEKMHLEEFQVDKIKNGRLSAIIHLDRPDIAEYQENRLRYLHHYYKTNCKVSGEDAF